MDHSHWLLIIFWLGYCIVHSVMADINVKNGIQKVMGTANRYYRPLYSIFATVTLAPILWFQFSLQSPGLIRITPFIYLPGILIAATGLSIMLFCIRKYFYELSGLQAVQHSLIKNTLHQSGLHKYVRHPLYFGTLLFIWGLFLIFPFISNLVAAVIITLYTLFGIKLEEKKLLIEYGEDYSAYSKKVPKLFPHIYIIKKGSA